MRKILFILTAVITLLVLIPISISDEINDKLFTASSVRINLDINSKLLVNAGNDAKLSKVSINLSFFPRVSHVQAVESLSTDPKSTLHDNTLQFLLTNSAIEDIDLNVNSILSIKNNHPQIKEKVIFPLTDLSDNLKQYTLPRNKIDSNETNIITISSFLVEGQDDEYKIVNKLADWTKENIKYNLTSYTANAALKASWVLENRYGVCDELTSLFIAMNRALGIPARFVSGVAYTNIEGGRFGPHGWAEIYFPGTGWVPFDVTYGQFGYVDATHIKLKESFDPDDNTMSFEWTGRGVNIDSTPLKFDTNIISVEYNNIAPRLSLNINIFDNKVSPKSYNLIEVKIKNLENYYVSRELLLGEVKDMYVDDNSRFVVLGPNEEKTIFWIVEFNGEFEKNYIITVPIVVYSVDGMNFSSSFEVAYSGDTYDKIDFEKIISSKDNEEKKVFSKDLNLECTPKSKESYNYEKVNIECNLMNKGNTFFRSLSICYNNDCSVIDLPINQMITKKYLFTPVKIGHAQLSIIAKNQDVSKTAFIDINVNDIPKLNITHLSYPSSVLFNDFFSINFTLSKLTDSRASNIRLNISSDGNLNPENVYLKYMDDDKNFNLNFVGEDLKEGVNKFVLLYSWTDDNNISFSARKDLIISLDHVSFLQKAKIFLKSLSFSLENWFS